MLARLNKKRTIPSKIKGGKKPTLRNTIEVER